MTAEATFLQCDEETTLVAGAIVAGGEVWQLATGEAAVRTGIASIAANGTAGFTTEGKFTMAKTATFVALAGLPAYWDHSANKVYYKKVNDRDFYIGRFVANATSAATSCIVDLNKDPAWDIDLLKGPVLSVPTGTAAAGAFGYPKMLGGAAVLELTATNEAQAIDMLSVDRFAVTSKGIAQFIIRPDVNGTTSAVDVNFGLANGTSTTDADAITEHVLFHIDGGATTINGQSKDGTTTVAAADTGAVISAGAAVANRTELWIDFRAATIVLYVNGVAATLPITCTLAAATGPMGLLAHIEKSTGTATGRFTIDAARAKLQQQA